MNNGEQTKQKRKRETERATDTHGRAAERVKIRAITLPFHRDTALYV